MNHTCKATLKVDYSSYGFDKGKVRTLTCCLFAPHPTRNHWSPSLLLTCGGETVKAKGWSYWNEGLKAPEK